MSSTLQNNELIMLSSLAYFEEFSDFKSIKIFEGEKYDVGTFVEHALNEGYETCFNDALSDEKNGMVEILKLVKQNPRLARLEIVYPDGFMDDKTIEDAEKKFKWRKDDTSSVCLVDPITKDVYVIFGGNYVAGSDAEFSTWVENFVGAVSPSTGEHENALRFYKDSIDAARAYLNDEDGDLNITVSGHSAAGNMAQYVTIAYGADED